MAWDLVRLSRSKRQELLASIGSKGEANCTVSELQKR
jgi:hypothetical protein